jgi:ribosome maturation factor RimP
MEKTKFAISSKRRSSPAMSRKRIIAAVRELALLPAQELGLELVDVEYTIEQGRWYLRVFVDKEGGVTLDDCQALSEKLDALLDRVNSISHAYILEVSSPGIERPLKTVADFQRFRGHLVKITTFAPQNEKGQLVGRLIDASGQTVVLGIGDDEIPISMRQVASARLVADVWEGKEVCKR